MSRYALTCLSLVLLTACGDLTRVPPPPVPLSALPSSRQAAAIGVDPLAPTTSASVRLVRAIPSDALFTLHVPDIGGTLQRFRKTALHEWLNRPEVKKDLGFVFDLFNVTGAGPAGVDVNRLKSALQGEFIVALEDVRVDPPDFTPDVRVIGGITVSGAEGDAEQLVELLGMLAAGQKGVTVEKGTAAGQPFTRIVGKTGKTTWVAEVAVYRDALLAGYGRDTVTAAIERLNKEEESSLSDNLGYHECVKRCGDPRDALRLHVDVSAALAKFGKLLPKDALHIIKGLRLDKIRSLGVAIRLEGTNITVSTLLDSPGGRDVVTQLLAAHPVDLHFLTRVPGAATSFSLFALDGRRVLRHVREALPKKMRGEFESGLKRLKKDGIDLEGEIFEVFGPRCALVNVPLGRPATEGLEMIWNHVLGTALIVEVRDPARAETILARLPDRTASMTRREFHVGRIKAVSYLYEAGEMPDDFALCYALDEGFLVAAPTEETLRRMLRERSPATAKRYRDLFKNVPETVAILSYDDMRFGLGLQMQALMQGVMQSLGQVAEDDKRARQTLPRISGNTVAYTIADERGVFSETRSPTGGLGSVGGLSGLAMLAAIAVPNVLSARVQANEATAVATLRAIHLAQETFRANGMRDMDNDGEGEFGFLAELRGQRRPGDTRVRNRRALLNERFMKQNGYHTRAGYHFIVYLPAEDGSPIGEHEKRSRLKQVDGDLAEAVMAVVAWPVTKGATGTRAFVLDATGTVYSCDGPYGGKKSPRPDVRASQPGNMASEPRRSGSNDGYRWARERER